MQNILNFIQENYAEIIGIVASAIVVVSMAFKTTTFKGTALMRIVNIVGCLIFFIYGLLIASWSVIILNVFCLILDIIYLIKEYIDYKKNSRPYDR